MSINDNALTGDEREAITAIHADLRTVKISKPEIDAILAKVLPKELSGLMESVSHLDRNNCLTRDTFEKIAVRTGKNNFNLLTTHHIIKALDRQGILNPRNIDLIFNSNSSLEERLVWKRMMFSLIDIGYLNQPNIDKIFLHPDFKNLISCFHLFCHDRWFFSKPYLDKLIDQKELKNLIFITDFMPDALWTDMDLVNIHYDKLLQCNAQLGNREIVKNVEKKDYRSLEAEVFNNLLDHCIKADTPEAAVKIFADQPRPLSHDEMIKLDNEQINNPTTLPSVPVLEQQPSSSRVERSVRSISAVLAESQIAVAAPPSSPHFIPLLEGRMNNAEYSSENRGTTPREGGVAQQNYSVNDTLLLGAYAASSLLKALGFKNSSLANNQSRVNNQPAVSNESVMDVNERKVNHILEKLRPTGKQHEGNNNSSFGFSPVTYR